MAIDYSQLIPNNVDLSSDRRLQRALENWQPRFLDWWKDMGPDGTSAFDVYLRTAVSTAARCCFFIFASDGATLLRASTYAASGEGMRAPSTRPHSAPCQYL